MKMLLLVAALVSFPTVALADPVSPLLEADAVSMPDLHAATLAALDAPPPANSPVLAALGAPTPSSPVRAAFDNLLVTVVLPGLGGILVVLFGAATLALKRYLDELGKTSRLARVANKALHLAEAVVQDLEATIKAEYERAAADGRITPEEARALRDLAIARLKSSLGQRGLEELQASLGLGGTGGMLSEQLIAVDRYLAGVVETAVAKVSAVAKVPALERRPVLAVP